jgi:hypothetical protein
MYRSFERFVIAVLLKRRCFWNLSVVEIKRKHKLLRHGKEFINREEVHSLSHIGIMPPCQTGSSPLSRDSHHLFRGDPPDHLSNVPKAFGKLIRPSNHFKMLLKHHLFPGFHFHPSASTTRD